MSHLPPYDNDWDAPLPDRNSKAYRDAFENYMRYGIPIPRLEAKAGQKDHPTTHYIWRTRGDGKVRASHAANDGKIFAWDDPPETGHPGEDYGCRCIAEPYISEDAEFFNIRLQNVSDSGPAWTSLDFVKHYFHGKGRSVTVRETGHLSNVVAEYRRLALDPPDRLPGQIADEARKNIDQSFSDTFGKPYDMTGVVFSIGHTTIKGKFSGSCRQTHALLEITGTIEFDLKDAFRDPLNLEEYQKWLSDKIDRYIIEAIDRGIEQVSEVIFYVSSKISEADRSLRDYIYDRALRELMRHGRKTAPRITGKAYPELPGGTPYDIVDNWSATFSARVLLDGQKSQFTK